MFRLSYKHSLEAVQHCPVENIIVVINSPACRAGRCCDASFVNNSVVVTRRGDLFWPLSFVINTYVAYRIIYYIANGLLI